MTGRPIYIGLGGNLGEVAANFSRTAETLGALGRVAARSSIWRSVPLDVSGTQPDFLNAVLCLHSSLALPEVLRALQCIEAGAGRPLRRARGSARTLDLDILLAGARGEEISSSPGLSVPHPRFAERDFVLWPLAEIAPELRPGGASSIAELRAQCIDRGLHRLDVPGWPGG
ncbi:MAG: 2-amino-4-hydroxy-6-hydroxymethyldihydropteridine diphosphokinase [Gammaproteobacteria bacterium AqS3]|nr:2-amino-4-hydroxy-6-hydroxymethyldihydropteridine diphosphokinase [Gammaproteobacteria bacterium AqS3]